MCGAELPSSPPSSSLRKNMLCTCLKCTHVWHSRVRGRTVPCPICHTHTLPAAAPPRPMGRPPKKPEPGPHPDKVLLPDSSPGKHRGAFTHVRILTAVSPGTGYATGLDGPLFVPGAAVPAELLRQHPVCLECAQAPQIGPVSEKLWVLWKYQRTSRTWREISRTRAHAWEWAIVLRPLAQRELEPPRQDEDPRDRAGAALASILAVIDSSLAQLPAAIRMNVLSELYSALAGRRARG